VNHTDLFCEPDQPIQLKSTNQISKESFYSVFAEKYNIQVWNKFSF